MRKTIFLLFMFISCSLFAMEEENVKLNDSLRLRYTKRELRLGGYETEIADRQKRLKKLNEQIKIADKMLGRKINGPYEDGYCCGFLTAGFGCIMLGATVMGAWHKFMLE